MLAAGVSSDLKSKASNAAEYYRFDFGSATRVFCNQMAREHAISLNISSHEPSAESLKAIAGARLDKMHGRRALSCMNELSRILDPTCINMGEKLQWEE